MNILLQNTSLMKERPLWGRGGAESCLTMQPLASLELDMWISDVLVLTEVYRVCLSMRGLETHITWPCGTTLLPRGTPFPQLPRLPTLPL